MSNLLSKGNKIYYIDYEDSKSSYTIVDIIEVKQENPGRVMKPELYYYVHSDNLSNATGYYPIFAEEVDRDDDCGRFFSSSEKAHKAYKKYKSRMAEKKEEN